ncbi:MAG: hypothetical protein ACWA41_06615 [Putridiphycobacter sp.]
MEKIKRQTIYKRITILLFLTTLVLGSCSKKVDVSEMERIFVMEIPNCYTLVENETIASEKGSTSIIEIRLEKGCFEEFYEEVSDFLGETVKFYRGTNPYLQPVFRNEKESAKLTIDPNTRVVHFEKLAPKREF